MKRCAVLVALATVVLTIGCSGNKPVAVSDTSDEYLAQGKLQLTVTEGSGSTESTGQQGQRRIAGRENGTDVVEHIWITIKEVQLHIAGDPSENGWKTVATPNSQFDFLELVNGLTAPLDLYALPAGHYTQIRLMLGDEAESGGEKVSENTIVINGETYPLLIPGAWRTGIKCVRPVFIAEDEVTEICLAFDAFAAIHYSAANGYMMRPAIRTYKCDGSPDDSPDETPDETPEDVPDDI